MKRFALFFSVLFSSFISLAQNLVFNGDFEAYSSCPTSFSQTTKCIGWRPFTSGTSDYFNCTLVPFLSFFGYQQPASGNAYMGGYAFTGSNQTTNTYKEYIAGTLSIPMQPGVTYDVSMSVNLSNTSGYGTDDVGIYFYKNGPATYTTTSVPPVAPQVTFTSYGPITDTADWVRVVASFYADSAYDNIVIGSWQQSAVAGKTVVTGGSYSYYYFDSVVVRVGGNISMNYGDSLICTGDTITVPYTINIPGHFGLANIFTLQLSDATGSFATPTVLATKAGVNSDFFKVVMPVVIPGTGYRLRIISDTPPDSSNASFFPIAIGSVLPLKPVASSNTPVCMSQQLNLSATCATPGVTYTWKGPNGFTSNLQNPTVTNTPGGIYDYVVWAKLYGCVAKDTETITVNGPAALSAGSDMIICSGDTLFLNASSSGTGTTYSWTGPNGFTSNIQNPKLLNTTIAANGTYIVTGTANGCSFNDTVLVVVKQSPVNGTAGSNSPVCTNAPIQFSGTGTPVTGAFYMWTGPNGFFEVIANPVIDHAALTDAGDYIFSATLNGCVVKDTITVVVVSAPALTIVAGSNTAVCEGAALNLTSTNSLTGSIYSWTGPNSFTSNTQNTSVSNIPLAGAGDYIVSVTLNGCVLKDTETVVVKPLPANFSASSNSPICTTKPINLLGNTTSTGVTYSWIGPGAFSNTNQNPTIATAITANGGDYILTATLNGCSIKDTTTVVVNESPAGAVVAAANTPVCQNTQLNLTATGSLTGSVYSWTGPSFTSAQQNPDINNIQPSAAGDYIISLSLNGCTVKDTVTVAVLIAPTNVNATSNTPICAGQTLTLDVTNSTPGVSYSWAGPSFTASSQSASIGSATPAATGDYIATLSINGCVVKDTVSVVVNPIPTTPTANSNTPVCQGNPINLYAGASLPGATYNWSGPSYTSNQQNPIIPNANTGMTGTYTVSASLNGCTSPTATTNVNVLYYPSSVNLYVLPNDTICVGSSIQLVAVASNGGPVPQYKWLKNGFPISGATSVSYNATTVTDKDKFRVILTPDNSCPDPDTSAPLEMTVLPYVKPAVSITATPTTVISPWQTITFHATPVNGGSNPTYQWKRNGQDVVGAVNDTWGAYTLGDNDVISAVLYSSEICPSPATATSNDIHITVKLGVADVKENAGDFVLYPNPNNGNFTLKGQTGTSQPVTAEMWNSIGQLVHREMLNPINGMLNNTITTNKNLATGVYILKLQTGDGSQLLRFTISK